MRALAEMEQAVKKGVARIFRVGEEQVSCAHFLSEFSADSLDYVDLMMWLEARLGCSLPDSLFTGAKTVGDIVACIAGNRQTEVV